MNDNDVKGNRSCTTPPDYAKEQFTLDEGPVIIQWPSELSEESVQDLEYWMAGMLRRARRKAGLQQDTSNARRLLFSR